MATRFLSNRFWWLAPSLLSLILLGVAESHHPGGGVWTGSVENTPQYVVCLSVQVGYPKLLVIFFALHQFLRTTRIALGRRCVIGVGS